MAIRSPDPVSDARHNILVYRDRIAPRSEAHFLRRLYIGFERLTPVWIGRHRGEGLADLGTDPFFLGASGWRGVFDRGRFKHLGALPSAPDLRALNPRLVHAHFGRGGALALPIARALGVPLIVHYHGGDATKDKHYHRGLVPTIYQRRLAALQREAALIICVSGFIRDRLLARGFPPDKLLVHRYGVEMDQMAPEEVPCHLERPYLLFAGRFVEKKGIGFLIEAARRLESEGEVIRLMLVGDGPIAGELRRAADGLRGVEFSGWLPNRELRRLMRGALAVCVPSVEAESGDAEGLPNVVLEAMAEGVPVIATNHAGIGEAVEHGRTGLLVPSGDAAALADAMRRLIDAPEMARAMGADARRIALDRFDAMAQSRRLEQIFLDVIAGSTRRDPASLHHSGQDRREIASPRSR
ncbi:MAG TPA: glycosyltransferase [Stellaceae bacterium]|nr:glycosyltransferase [Stellaceae bacterium]